MKTVQHFRRTFLVVSLRLTHTLSQIIKCFCEFKFGKKRRNHMATKNSIRFLRCTLFLFFSLLFDWIQRHKSLRTNESTIYNNFRISLFNPIIILLQLNSWLLKFKVAWIVDYKKKCHNTINHRMGTIYCNTIVEMFYTILLQLFLHASHIHVLQYIVNTIVNIMF